PWRCPSGAPMSKKTLTEFALRTAQTPQAARLMLWDGALKHFGVRVSPAGLKTFIVLLGSGRRHAIGHYPVLSLSEVREKAKRILAERALGRYHTISISWQAAVQKFIEARRSRTRPSTIAEYARSLRRYFAFGTTRLSDITKQDLAHKLEQLNRTPAMQDHALVTCKTFLRWCLLQGFIDVDPAAALRRGRPRRRTRVLSDDELRQVWQVCQEGCAQLGADSVLERDGSDRFFAMETTKTQCPV
ncbi:MAG: integrase arm-type DNA-binding domain-containing protein, partial [Rhizomicrobium sp.]